MSDEPLSVQVSRLKGCEPKYHTADPGIDHSKDMWLCHCVAVHGPDSLAIPRVLWLDDGYESWLTPAASFALLSEMAEGWCKPECDKQPIPDQPGRYEYACIIEIDDDQRHGPIYETFVAPALAEAIAKAWLAWKQP